jgi:hypothetical protein
MTQEVECTEGILLLKVLDVLHKRSKSYIIKIGKGNENMSKKLTR